MAGHLLVKNTENKHVVNLIKDFLSVVDTDKMHEFLLHDCHGRLVSREEICQTYRAYQKLTDRNEIKDRLVLSIYPLDMVWNGETTENAIAEVHITNDNKYKIYQVY